MSIRVLILRPDLTHGYDVTDRAESLIFSNVNPGGHERATFTLKGSWGRGFPEVRRGNIVRVEDGFVELFTGRIDEQDPQVQDAEQVSVTAYGLGVRCKDDVMREIYVDCDLTRWTGPSVQRRISLASAFGVQEHTVVPDATTGQPAMELAVQGAWTLTTKPVLEPLYDSQGILIGSIYYAFKINSNISAADTNWSWQVFAMTTDTFTSTNATANLRAASGSGTLATSGGNKIFGGLDFSYATGPGGANNSDFKLWFTCLAVYGTHGLTKQGVATVSTPQGFFASQVVQDVCARLAADGIVARRVDTSNFVITQLVFLNDVPHEDVITEVSKYHDVDWGVWGANTLTGDWSNPSIGYLDWTVRDSSIATWTAYRDECEEVDLHTEIGSTFDQVAVSYTDVTGLNRRVLRTIQSNALADAGIPTRTAALQGGTLTLAGAQQLGDAFLALAAGNPVSRGQAIIKGPIRHLSGHKKAHFMRADGSNLLIPDAFPDRDSFALKTSADRQAIFPIKRVTVDCSGDEPQTTVELDQTHDLLSILLARLQLASGVALGAGG